LEGKSIIIIEGCRRSGKSYTLEAIQEAYPHYIHYKDKGMRHIKDTDIDPDDYAIGRDMAYAQFFPNLPYIVLNKLILDRQYWSSYVYGQFYRKKYSKEFWRQHVIEVESRLFSEDDKVRRHVNILLIKPNENDFERMARMERNKDWLEDSDINSYKKQWKLYEELIDISTAEIMLLKAFQGKEYIVETVREIMKQEDTEWCC
jgi:hypothetical protein